MQVRLPVMYIGVYEVLRGVCATSCPSGVTIGLRQPKCLLDASRWCMRMPELVWNPKRGYYCSACEWTKRVHIQPQLPEDDAISEWVREEFAAHVRDKHADARGSASESALAARRYS